MKLDRNKNKFIILSWNFLRSGNPTPKIALGVETPSEYEPSRGEYPMILEHPWEEEGRAFSPYQCVITNHCDQVAV